MTSSGNSHGTLILAVVTNRGAYICADSRGTSPPSDTEQKVFKCGDIGFAGIAGTLVDRTRIWTMDRSKVICCGKFYTHSILDEACTSYAGDVYSLSGNVRSHIDKLLRPYWECFVKPTATTFLQQSAGNFTFCQIPIVTWREARAHMSIVDFNFSELSATLLPAREAESFVEPRDNFQQIGQWGQTVNTNGIDFSGDSHERVLQVIETVYTRAAETYPNTIGGPIDIGFVDQTGARWIAKKPGLSQTSTNK